MRPAMQRSGETADALFFKTDHLWTPLAAAYAVQELTASVETKYGDIWDAEGCFTDPAQYERQLYEQAVLGSFGKKTGEIYSGREDYLLLWQECGMEFSWIDHDKDIEQRGSFAEAFFDRSVSEAVLMDTGSLGDAKGYPPDLSSVYLGRTADHDKIINHSNTTGVRLAVLRDQYFSPMACFLAPMCSEIEMVRNKRTYNDIDYEAFVQECEADYVILEIYPYNLQEYCFDFFKK